MIRVLPEQKIVLLENEALRVALDYSCGLHFAEFSNRFGAGKSNVWRELFTLRAYGGEYASETFTCTNVSHAKDEALEMATFLLENCELCMKMRVHLMDEGKRELRLTYQLWDDYKNGTPAEVFLHIPFLAQFESGESAERKYYPLNTVRDKDGADVLHRVNETFYSSDIVMPFVVCGENGRGFSMEFPVPSDLSDLFGSECQLPFLPHLQRDGASDASGRPESRRLLQRHRRSHHRRSRGWLGRGVRRLPQKMASVVRFLRVRA